MMSNGQAQLQKDLKSLQQKMTKFEKRQVPFAMSLALNQVATFGQRAAKRGMKQRLDNPTPFTQRGIKVKRSSKNNLVSEVFIADIQAEYLQYAIYGGVRQPKSKAILVPFQQRLNKYGNMPKNKVKSLLKRDDVFVVSSTTRDNRSRGLPSGIYQRFKRGNIKLLIAFEPKAKYEKRYPFGSMVINEANRYLVSSFRQSMARALSTAR